jgi:hypothetical protein
MALLLIAFAAFSPAHAQVGGPQIGLAPDALHQTADKVTISLLTMGNGEQVWEKFGHTAIMIRDNVTGRDTVFNWGVFDMTRPYFIPHFLEGLMMYQMGGNRLEDVLYAYRYYNRTVTSQELALTTPQKDSLLRIIRLNAQPENITYRYDYFQNNCSTRPRDILDAVLGGLLKANSSEITATSYRWHAERLMQGDKLLVMGVHIGLGEPSDRPVTRWQTMFLPKQLHDLVATLETRDSTGATKPLVVHETVLFQGTRPPEPAAPPNLVPLMLAIGLVVAGVFAWLGARAESASHGLRVVAAILFGLWSLIAGLLGVVLTLLWTVTDHIFAHANENLLLFNPLWLALVVLLPMWWLSGRGARATRAIVYAIAALSAVALVAHLVMLSRQANLAVIGLALPPSLAIAWMVWRWRDGAAHGWTTVIGFTTAAPQSAADPRPAALR